MMNVDIENCKTEIEEFKEFVYSGSEYTPEMNSSTESSISSLYYSSSVPSSDASQGAKPYDGREQRTEHTNIYEKIVIKRKMGAGCERTCRLRCQQNISIGFRKELFIRFWAIGNINLQREYLLNKIKSPAIITKSQRERNKHYFLPKSENRENENIRVCKITFMDTFGITRQWIATIFAKLGDHNTLTPDMRGRNRRKVYAEVRELQSNTVKKKIRTAFRMGLEHRNIHGKIVPARKMGPGCGRMCRLKCQQTISVEFRKELFKRFWAIGNASLQREYLVKKIKSTPRTTTSARDDKRTGGNKHYFLPKSKDCENENIRVCKTMFMDTFGINRQWIATIFAKLDGHNILTTDMHGKHHEKKNPHATYVTSVPNITEGTNNEETKVSHDFDLETIKEEPEVSFTDEIVSLGNNEFDTFQDSFDPPEKVCQFCNTNNLTACTCSLRLILMEDRQDRMEKKLDELLDLVRDLSKRRKN